MSTTIYINGTDRTSDIPFQSLRYSRETGFKASECTFRLEDISTFPSEGDLFELWEDSDLLFGGRIMISEKDSPVPKKTGNFTAIDWYDKLLELYVRTSYEDETLYSIVRDIIQSKVHMEDLKLMWRFFEGTGTSVADDSQFDNDGTINGSGYAWDTSNYGIEFDNTAGQYISSPDQGELDFSSAVSLCMDISLDARNVIILEKDGGGGNAPYKITVGSTGNITFAVADATTVYTLATTNTPISTGTRYRITCVFDQTTGFGYIYVNGALNISGALTTNALRASTGVLKIGQSSGTTIDGKVFRVSIYGKALSAIEVRRWYLDILEVKAPTHLMAQNTYVIDNISFSYKYPAECFTELANLIGINWRINERMFLVWEEIAGGASVATFADDDGTTIKDTIFVDKNISEVRNAIFVRGGFYLADWRSDLILTDGGSTVYPLPYKYTGFEMFASSHTLATYIQSWYKMEDGSGNLTDTKGVNTLVAANLTYAQAGKLSNAIDWNGTTSSARKTSATHETGNADHSISAWIKPDTFDTTERIVAGFGDFAGGHSKLSLIVVSGAYYLRHNFGDSIVNDIAIGNIVTGGAWHLVGMSYDPDNEDGKTLRLYLDGVLMTTVILTSTPDIDAGVMEIGGNNGSNVFDGDIDEVTFFKWALSDQEHLALYNMANTSTTSAALLHTGVEFLDTSGFDGYYNYAEKNYRFSSAPAGSLTLYPTGKPEIPVQALRSSTDSITTYGRRELEINDSSIESLPLARARAGAELSKRKNPPVKVSFSTHTSGIDPGETITLDFPSHGATADYVVQKVTTSAWLPVTSGGKKFLYEIECVSVLAKDWIDFFRDLARKSTKIDPSESEPVQDLIDHGEDITVAEVWSTPADTAHAEDITTAEVWTLNETPSGDWKWSNDAGTTPDKLRWNLGDWG